MGCPVLPPAPKLLFEIPLTPLRLLVASAQCHPPALMLENYTHITAVVWCAVPCAVASRAATPSTRWQQPTYVGWTALWCTHKSSSGGALGDTSQFSGMIPH